jgi:hypothetical protein
VDTVNQNRVVGVPLATLRTQDRADVIQDILKGIKAHSRRLIKEGKTGYYQFYRDMPLSIIWAVLELVGYTFKDIVMMGFHEAHIIVPAPKYIAEAKNKKGE